MFELIYTSVPGRNDIDVKSILETAHKFNPSHDITGLLCYDGKRFIQILEGDEAVILSLFSSIEKDERHTEIELLHSGGIEERSFTTWSMAYESFSVHILDSLSENIGVMSMVEANDKVAKIGESFGARLFGLFFRSTYDLSPAKSL